MIIVVRHGQTANNRQGRLQGSRLDSGIDPIGVAQAYSALDSLRGLGFSVKCCYTSGLKRAKMTASIISYGLKLPVRISPDLNERDFGSLSGLSWSEIERDLGVDLKSADKALTYDYRGFGGEDIEQVKERISRFLETMRCEEKGNDVLCVTHDGIIKLFYESLPHEHRTPIENGTVHLFRASI